MRTNNYLLLCLFLFSCGQTQNNAGEADTAMLNTDAPRVSADLDSVSLDSVVINTSSVEGIKRAFVSINTKLQAGKLDAITMEYNCNKERKGTVTYFSDNGHLVAIKHNYSEYDHFSAVDQYFVHHDQLFFAHLNRVAWSFESGNAAEGATKDNITEQRIYINNDKALLCLEKKYVKRSHSSDNPLPQNVQNREVACQPIMPVLKNFSGLLAFKDSSDKDCLKK